VRDASRAKHLTYPSGRPEKNSVKKMTIFIARNKNTIKPMNEVQPLGSIYRN
jgi:hypothetical protein